MDATVVLKVRLRAFPPKEKKWNNLPARVSVWIVILLQQVPPKKNSWHKSWQPDGGDERSANGRIRQKPGSRDPDGLSYPKDMKTLRTKSSERFDLRMPLPDLPPKNTGAK
jgi:hypothetical protein